MDNIERICMTVMIIGIGLGVFLSIYFDTKSNPFDIKVAFASGFCLGCGTIAAILVLIYIGGGK